VEDDPVDLDSDWLLTEPTRPSPDGLVEGREGSVEGQGAWGIR